jgi:hypothetical protein
MTVKLEWQLFEDGEFEIHVLPIFAQKNVGTDDISGEPYAFTGRVQRAGSDGRYGEAYVQFKSAAYVEYRTAEEALNTGLEQGREIVRAGQADHLK